MEPTRLIVAIEVKAGDTQDFYEALQMFFVTKAADVNYSIKRVELIAEDVEENGQTD